MPLVKPRHVLVSPAAALRSAKLGLKFMELDGIRAVLSWRPLGKRIARFPWLSWLHHPAGIYRHGAEVADESGDPFRISMTTFDFSSLAAVIMTVDRPGEGMPASAFQTPEVMREAHQLYRDLTMALA